MAAGRLCIPWLLVQQTHPRTIQAVFTARAKKLEYSTGETFWMQVHTKYGVTSSLRVCVCACV